MLIVILIIGEHVQKCMAAIIIKWLKRCCQFL